MASSRDVQAKHRDEAAARRDQDAALRDLDAESRDELAVARGKDAERRDEQAERRDESAEQRDQASASHEVWSGTTSPSGKLSRTGVARRDAAADRRLSRHDREMAAAERDNADLDRHESDGDRTGSGDDRRLAEHDRGASSADRVASARERQVASLDALTGAYLRGPGLLELERDFARSRRTGLPLVLAFVDVDRLKAVNDAGGHAAGDALLRRVANALEAKLRPYDILIRFGGDEFVCGLAGLDLAGASERIQLVHAALTESPELGSVTVGLAEIGPDDSLESLIRRADTALYTQRQRSR